MTMKIIAKMLLLVVLVVPVAYAQGPLVAGVAPVLEAGAGYTYTYAGVPGQTDKLAMNGVQVVGDADFSRRLGVQLDLGYSGILTHTIPTTPPIYSPTWLVRSFTPCAHGG